MKAHQSLDMNNFYTYAYLRIDGTPYYIGKGKGNRAYKKHVGIKVPPQERILILKQNLSNDAAIKHEIYMINVLGRKNIGTGMLRNLTDGGEGSVNRKISEETRRKMIKAAKERKISEEGRKKLSERSHRLKKWKGKDNPWFNKTGPNKGKKLSEETRKKISSARKGVKINRELKPISTCRPIRVFFKDGTVVECWGIREFKRKYGYSPSMDKKRNKFYGKAKNILKVETISLEDFYRSQ